VICDCEIYCGVEAMKFLLQIFGALCMLGIVSYFIERWGNEEVVK